MGSCCSKTLDDEEYEQYYADNNNKYGSRACSQSSFRAAVGGGVDQRRMTTVAMLANMAHQAGGFMNQVATHQQMHGGDLILDPLDFQDRVRKAKAETRTVTIRNDCLYIDYDLVGRIPAGMASLAY